MPRVALVAALLLTACGDDRADRSGPPGSTAPSGSVSAAPGPTPSRPAELPQGGRSIFPAHRIVAFYGTADNPRLGVLGESTPEGILPRLHQAAAGFATPDRK